MRRWEEGRCAVAVGAARSAVDAQHAKEHTSCERDGDADQIERPVRVAQEHHAAKEDERLVHIREDEHRRRGDVLLRIERRPADDEAADAREHEEANGLHRSAVETQCRNVRRPQLVLARRE